MTRTGSPGGIWHDRTPKLITQIRDGHPYAPDAVGYFEPGPWRWVDPFEPMKSAKLTDRGLEPDLAALDDLEPLSIKDRERAILLASLWGNRANLGFRIGVSPARSDIEPARVITDQSASLWAALGPDANVIVVTDNAGRELLADLVLVDHLIQHQHAASISLHVKPHLYCARPSRPVHPRRLSARLVRLRVPALHRRHALARWFPPWFPLRAPEDQHMLRPGEVFTFGRGLRGCGLLMVASTG